MTLTMQCVHSSRTRFRVHFFISHIAYMIYHIVFNMNRWIIIHTLFFVHHIHWFALISGSLPFVHTFGTFNLIIICCCCIWREYSYRHEQCVMWRAARIWRCGFSVMVFMCKISQFIIHLLNRCFSHGLWHSRTRAVITKQFFKQSTTTETVSSRLVMKHILPIFLIRRV